MKNLILILILVLSIFTSSCKHQKQIIKTDIHETTDSIVKLDIETIDIISDIAQTETTVTANEIKTDFSEETITIVEYSIPDSSGVQSIIRTVTTTRKNDIKTDTRTKIEIKDSTAFKQVRTFRDRSSTEFHSKVKSKTVTKTKTLDRSWLVIVVLILLIIGIAWLIWKYYPR
ncbi:MAG: hypothetical protein RBT49_15855 [Bacteroidales bacterium]|jgi:hypothetical protein|nr:hypothetical protein [Bacteroidales bacterium]